MRSGGNQPQGEVPNRVMSEMPRLRRFLRVTVLTWLPLIIIACALGGILTARTLKANYIGSFVGGAIMIVLVAALPSLGMVAIYVWSAVLVRKEGLAGTLLRLALAIGSVILVTGLTLTLKQLTMNEPGPWWWIRTTYQGWLIGALCLTPVLVFIHGRIK